MSPEEIFCRVKAIGEIARDDEAAHGEEDRLHQDVLRAIANGKCERPSECAALALGTLMIAFQRWCA